METDLVQPVRDTSFPEHLFTAHWQQAQLKLLLNTLMPVEVLMVEDFVENRKASFSSEVKSAYFSKEQITLHPIVTYYKDGEYQLARYSLVYRSDDLCNDHNLVNHFTLHAFEFLKAETSVQSAFILRNPENAPGGEDCQTRPPVQNTVQAVLEMLACASTNHMLVNLPPTS
ncbi:hypothetical protein ElyMa_001342800 [Elysia marginata]|uniref:Uncharacterized protein n=1 Tax=Elysia marginata TaxID=1093978 RepID=A0AAV4IL75_9GAST|nr:hypothetical protein ElyMa_001342800 [Elysia marginata]